MGTHGVVIMGLFDIFGGGSKKGSEKTVAKAAQKLRNPHVQPQERQRQIEILQSIATPEAVEAMLQRFTMRTPGAIVDEDEKRMTYEALIRLGNVCLEPIERFVRSESSIYWPLRALTEIGGHERAVSLILTALGEAEHGYDAETERREQLVSNLREFPDDARALEKLLELTRDESVEVRILAIDGLTEFESPQVLKTLVERLSDPEEAVRVKSTIVDIFADRGLELGEFAEVVGPQLPEMFVLGEDGRVTRQ